MRKIILGTLLVGLVAAALPARALEVLVLTTVTRMDPAPSPSRAGLELQNRGPASIYCKQGTSTGLAVGNGREIKPGGTWAPPAVAQLRMWCIAAGAQLASAGTNVQELFPPYAGAGVLGTNTGDVTIGTANGLSMSGQVLSLGVASATDPGAVSSTVFARLANTSGTNTGDVTIGTANGLRIAGQALSLDPAQAGTAGAVPAAGVDPTLLTTGTPGRYWCHTGGSQTMLLTSAAGGSLMHYVFPGPSRARLANVVAYQYSAGVGGTSWTLDVKHATGSLSMMATPGPTGTLASGTEKVTDIAGYVALPSGWSRGAIKTNGDQIVQPGERIYVVSTESGTYSTHASLVVTICFEPF